ncbi:MAG: DUF5666 domain-containing protein [Lysinibacillus sp.]
MKSWSKLSVIAGVLVIAGAGAAFGYEEFYDEKNGYQDYVSSADAIEAAPASASTSPSQPTSPFSDVDGKVTEVTDEKITVDVPFQGTKTFTIDKNTKIEDFLQPLKKGSLVDIEANGDVAYKIEAEQTMDAHGTIIAVTDQEVTIHYNGTEQSFKKAAKFQVDADGYIGAIEGLPAEISLNENLEIVELEIENDLDD